eukprot:SAG22_NODE_1595_length_4037_cov_45.725495_1_plen_185_part_00
MIALRGTGIVPLFLLSRLGHAQVKPLPVTTSDDSEPEVAPPTAAAPRQLQAQQPAGRALQAGAVPVPPACLQLRDGSNVRPHHPTQQRLHISLTPQASNNSFGSCMLLTVRELGLRPHCQICYGYCSAGNMEGLGPCGDLEWGPAHCHSEPAVPCRHSTCEAAGVACPGAIDPPGMSGHTHCRL